MLKKGDKVKLSSNVKCDCPTCTSIRKHGGKIKKVLAIENCYVETIYGDEGCYSLKDLVLLPSINKSRKVQAKK